MKKGEYIDKKLTLLMRKMNDSQKKLIDGEKMVYKDFSMVLYAGFEDMDEIRRYAQYPRDSRPDIIKVNKNACITINSIVDKRVDFDSAYERVKMLIKRIYSRNVFYGEGKIKTEVGDVNWFECKGFGMDGIYYSMFFLFDTETSRIQGNFHCPFSEYDIWKPMVIEMLSSVQSVCKENGYAGS